MKLIVGKRSVGKRALYLIPWLDSCERVRAALQALPYASPLFWRQLLGQFPVVPGVGLSGRPVPPSGRKKTALLNLSDEEDQFPSVYFFSVIFRDNYLQKTKESERERAHSFYLSNKVSTLHTLTSALPDSKGIYGC